MNEGGWKFGSRAFVTSWRGRWSLHPSMGGNVATAMATRSQKEYPKNPVAPKGRNGRDAATHRKDKIQYT